MNTRILLLLAIFLIHAATAENGLDVNALSGKSKKFFFDVSFSKLMSNLTEIDFFQMTKQVMGVPSLKPENLAAQAFFRNFLDKYTKLDDKIKNDMTQHVPKATKLFDAAGMIPKLSSWLKQFFSEEVQHWPIECFQNVVHILRDF